MNHPHLAPLALCVVFGCSGAKRAECAAVLDVMTPVGEAAHTALERYDPTQIERFRGALGQAKPKLVALRLSDERLLVYRGELAAFVEQAEQALQQRPGEPQLGPPVDFRRSAETMAALKAYCE